MHFICSDHIPLFRSDLLKERLPPHRRPLHFHCKHFQELTRHTFIRHVWAPSTREEHRRPILTFPLKRCCFSPSPLLHTSARATFSGAAQPRTKPARAGRGKLASAGPRGTKAERARRGGAAGTRSLPAPRAPRRAARPGSPDPRADPPGAAFSMETRGWGREGAEARVQTAATGLRLPRPGFQARGSPPGPGRGYGASWRWEAGREGGARPRRPGRARELGPAPDPGKHFGASPAPLAKMATWTEAGGARPARLGGSEGGEGRQEQKRRPPPPFPERRGRPGSPGRGGGRGRRRRAQGMGLLFFVVRAAGALHGESVAAMPSRPAPPGARSGLKLDLSARGERSRGASRGAQPRGRSDSGGTGGKRRAPGRARRSLPSGSLSRRLAAATGAILASPRTRLHCALWR